MKLTVGVFFGGKSRDTGWSVAAANTLTQYLDSALFEPLPIFVDQELQLFLPDKPLGFPVQLSPEDWAKPLSYTHLQDLVNAAWITLNAEFDETAELQQRLLDLGIPFTGNPPAQHRAVWDKVFQKDLLGQLHVATPDFRILSRKDLDTQDPTSILKELAKHPGFPCILKSAWGEVPATGSLLDANTQPADFLSAANRVLFREILLPSEWLDRSEYEKRDWVQLVCDPTEGPGLPILAEGMLLQSEAALFAFLEEHCTAAAAVDSPLMLEYPGKQEFVLIEQVPDGQDFSCFVIRNARNEWTALPPCSRSLKDDLYFFYNPDTPHSVSVQTLDLTDSQLLAIRHLAEKLAERLEWSTLVLIEGTLTHDKRILVSEIRNTTKFYEGAPIFQLAATQNLTPVQLLSQLLSSALYERSQDFPEKPSFRFLYQYLKEQELSRETSRTGQQQVGIFLGDMLRDQELALENARFLYSQLEASSRWHPEVYYIKGQTPFLEFSKVPGQWLFEGNVKSFFDRIPLSSKKILPTDLKKEIHLAWLCFGDSHPNTTKIKQLLGHLELPTVSQEALHSSSVLEILHGQGVPVASLTFSPDAVPTAASAARFPVLVRLDGTIHHVPPLLLSPKEISSNIRLHDKQSFIFERNPEWAAQLEKITYPWVQQVVQTIPITGYAAIDVLITPEPDGSHHIRIAAVHTLPWIYKDSALIRSVLQQGQAPIEVLEMILADAKKYDVMETPQQQPETPPPPTEDSKASFLELAKVQAKYFLQTLGAFVLSPAFRRNALALVGVSALLYLVLVLSLRLFTHHGSSLQIQDFTGMNVASAKAKAREGKLELIIADSIFLVDEMPGIILNQYPKPFSRVKKNRSVYVTVNSSSPPPVILPGLVGAYDYGQYTRKLQRLGIKYRVLEKRFDAKLEANTILTVYFDGREISDNELRQGFRVPKGSTLDFIVTERKSNQVSIPDLRCKTYNQAAFVLSSVGLEIGQIQGDVADYSTAYVYRQDPPPTDALVAGLGTRINLYLSNTLPDDCDTPTNAPDSLSNND